MSLVLVAGGLALLLLAVTIVTAGSSNVARHRARNAADAGALAGAQYAIDGEVVACAHAERLVTANRARLVSCRTEGLDVVVSVASGPANAAARAGPVRVGPVGGTHDGD